MPIKLKRIYDKQEMEDGYRILVDRVWPRGLSKDEARLDDWFKEIAPSTKLRKWFHEDPTRWHEFRNHYLSELKEHREELRDLAEKAKQETVTLLYSSKDEKHNNAIVLKQYLEMLQH